MFAFSAEDFFPFFITQSASFRVKRLSLFLEQQRSPDEDPSPFNWGRLLILGGVVALYIFTASIDPVPESSWSVFYREMLSTGEVRCYLQFALFTRPISMMPF